MNSVRGQAVPVLDDREGGNLDWPSAEYAPAVSAGQAGRVEVHHALSGADSLKRLVESGCCRWAVEVRSVSTYFAKLFVAEQGSDLHRFEIPKATLAASGVHVFPGLVSVTPCELPITSSELNPVWRRCGRDYLEVPQGVWLVRGRHHDLIGNTSIVRFVLDPSIAVGFLRREYAEEAGSPHWNISVNPEVVKLVERSADRALSATLGMAAFVAALSDAENWRKHFKDGDPINPLARDLWQKLRSANSDSLPPDHPEFDPLRAASLLSEELQVLCAEVEANTE